MNNIEKIVDILESGQQPSRSECSFFVNKVFSGGVDKDVITNCLLYTSPSPRDGLLSRMPSSA